MVSEEEGTGTWLRLFWLLCWWTSRFVSLIWQTPICAETDLQRSIMASRLLPSIGFAWTIRTIAFMYMAFLGIATLTVRTRLEHQPMPFKPAALFRPLKEKPVALTAAASFFCFMGVFVPYDFLVVYARHQQMPSNAGLILLAVANGVR